MIPLLRIDGLGVSVQRDGGSLALTQSVDLVVRQGEAVGLVGESGSGKSVTARAAIGLLPRRAQTTGHVWIEGRDILAMDRRALQEARRTSVSMIFQDPRSAIDPVRTVGHFLTETLRRHDKLSRMEAAERAAEALREVGVGDAEHRMRQYPHEFSGGMLQRVMISAALLSGSRLLLADEPTTALDVTTQSGVVALLDRLRRERDLGLLFITHDLELATAICDRICVMYAGRIVEDRPARDFEATAQHPYSRALFAARPTVHETLDRLPAIPGRPLAAFEVGDGCAFADRCVFVEPECRTGDMQLREVRGHLVRCRRAQELNFDASTDGAIL